MKIDAINFGAFTPQTQQIQSDQVVEKTSSPLDTFDDTRFANDKASNPIEQKQISFEGLEELRISTEHMVQSYGFPSIDAAIAATSPSQSTGGGDSVSSAVSAVSGSSTSSVGQ